MQYLYGAILMKAGDVEKGQALLKNAASRSALTHYFARTWLIRMGVQEEKEILQFVSPEIENLFVTYC